MDGVMVTRVGTQVVVRLSGVVDDTCDRRLGAALDEVAGLVLNRVVVDLTDTSAVAGAGLDFILAAEERWTLRVLGPPAGLRQRLAERRQDRDAPGNGVAV
jgi:hypothetical protein